MHIPDGYLGLQTTIPAFGAMVPIWSAAAGKVKKLAGGRQIPLLSLCAAFSFVIMMFNIPVGPSSVHAIGAVFAAVLLGPWASCIAISVAIVIQALVFGDGGVLAIGINCFNMAFAMSFSGYGIFRLVAGRSAITSKRSLAGILAGSYIGINAAALLTAVEFGIQPLLFRSASGIPLYGFYPLSISVPAIMTGHLLVAGPVEAVITVFAVVYLARYSPHLLDRARQGGRAHNRVTDEASIDGGAASAIPGIPAGSSTIPGMPAASYGSFFKRYRAFIIGLSVMVAAVPLGQLATGKAWGEWKPEEIKGMLGYIPSGLEKLSGLWKSILPDYKLRGLQGTFLGSSIGYVISAAAGVLLIVILALVSSRFMVKRDKHDK